MQTFFVKYPIQGSLKEIKKWASELNARLDEVTESLKDAGVTVECAAIDFQNDGAYIIYFMKVKDIQYALKTSKKSLRKIDIFHHKILSENLGKPTSLNILIDFER